MSMLHMKKLQFLITKEMVESKKSKKLFISQIFEPL